MSLPFVTVHWRDNNGAKSETRFYAGGHESLPAFRARAEPIIAALEAVSLAALVRYDFSWRFPYTSAEPPALDSNVDANLLLFYGNSTSAATLRVPSPRPLSVDLVGPYRNVRLVLAAPDVSPLLAALGSQLNGAVSPGGNDWPLPLLAGGFTRYRGP
jgi:hypothetical protein